MLKITIHTDNDAFQPVQETELGRILENFGRYLIEHAGHVRKTGRLYDINGNNVGEWSLDPQEEE